MAPTTESNRQCANCGLGAVSSSSNVAQCTACNGITAYSDQTDGTECQPILTCGPGEKETVAPSAENNRQCASFPITPPPVYANALLSLTFRLPEHFVPTISGWTQSPLPLLTWCEALHVGEECPPGTFSATNNALACTPCDGVTGYSSASKSSACLPILAPCDAKLQIQSQAPGPSQNRECLTCGLGGTYTDPKDGLCKVATNCKPGEYITKQVTPTTDRECGSTRLPLYLCACPPFLSLASTPSPCVHLFICTVQYHMDPTGNIVRLCHRHRLLCFAADMFLVAPACDGITVFSASANALSCDAVVPCDVTKGEEQVAPATKSSNTVCAVCVAGESYAVIAAGATVPSCKPATVCPVGHEQTTPGTSTSDRECGACLAGRFRDQAMLADPTSKCRDWSLCTNDQSYVSPAAGNCGCCTCSAYGCASDPRILTKTIRLAVLCCLVT